MTDEIDAKRGGKSPDDEDSTFDPASEDETKVVLESLEPPKPPEPVKPLAAAKYSRGIGSKDTTAADSPAARACDLSSLRIARWPRWIPS